MLPHRSAIITTLRAAGCVFAEDEADLLLSVAQSPQDLAGKVDQRVTGRPLEHIVGWVDFCGLRIAVDHGVFVPRRRSELLVTESVGLLTNADGAARGRVVLDMCCGCGAVGLALAHRVPGIEVHAVDIDPAAVRCARHNLEPIGGSAYLGDLDEPVPARLRGRVDLIIANAPYVPTAAIALMPPEARIHEPRVALDGGADGVDVQGRVADAAPTWLRPGGHLLVETSRRQAPITAEAFARNGLHPRIARSDELDATVVIGVRPG